ncbi:MAG: hypothetical protein ACFFAA_12405 [Promethearchaeota archaeon]
MGLMQGKMLQSQLRRKKVKRITPSIAGSLASGVLAGLGIVTEKLEESLEKMSYKITNCPVYEAAKLMGLDPEIVCRHSAVPFMNTIVKQIDPNLSYELEKYRLGPDGYCQESIVLKKEAVIVR